MLFFHIAIIDSSVIDSSVFDDYSFDVFIILKFSNRYLSALISQSFLDIGSVSRILDGIMKLCLQFCWKIENQENGSNTSELEHITEVP